MKARKKQRQENHTLNKLADDYTDWRATIYNTNSKYSEKTNATNKNFNGFNDSYDLRARYKKETGKEWNPAAAGALVAKVVKKERKKKKK